MKNSALSSIECLRVEREDLDNEYERIEDESESVLGIQGPRGSFSQPLGVQNRSSTLLSKSASSVPVRTSTMSIANYHDQLEILKQRIVVIENKMAISATIFQVINATLGKLENKKSKEKIDGSSVLNTISNHPKIKEFEQNIISTQKKIKESTQKDLQRQGSSKSISSQMSELREKTDKLEVNMSGYSQVDKLIRDTTTFEGYNINKYINDFLAGEKGLPGIWNFIDKIKMELAKQFSDVPEEQLSSSVENFIFPVLYNTMMQSFQLEDFDEFIFQQCKKYGQTTQEQLNINPDFIDKSIFPYGTAITELRSIYFQFSPTKKMMAILRAAAAVYEITGKLKPDYRVGGDDFIDIWVFCVLHAKIPNLASNVQYISNFGSEDLMTSEMGYYFTSLEIALTFIEKIAPEKLKVSPSSQITSRPFLVCEKQRYKNFCALNGKIAVTTERVCLSGFKLFVVENWFVDPGKFYSTFIQKTDNSNDKIFASVLKSSPSITASQQAFVHETFFTDKPAENLIVMDLAQGSLLCSSSPPPASLGCAIHIASGDFDEENTLVKMIVNVKRLNIPNLLPAAPYVEEQHIQYTCKTFGLDSSVPFPSALVEFVKHVQIGLKHLNLLPFIHPIDGIVTTITLRATKLFHTKYNQTNLDSNEGAVLRKFNVVERLRQLPVDIMITPDTLPCLRIFLKDVSTCLAFLGFSEVDPFLQAAEFTETIKQFQNTIKESPDGLLSNGCLSKIVLAVENKK